MKHGNKFLMNVCSIILAAVMILPLGVFAEETKDEGAERAAFVNEVIMHLRIYSRYEDVTQENLYKEALNQVLKKHPELYEEVMHALLESIDEHSEYYNADETHLLAENLTGIITGIGITFQMCDEGVDVRSVIADTPAARAGLKVGDIIVSANGTDLAGMNSDTAASNIKGDEGTSVEIGIKRDGEDEIIYVTLVREKIIGTSVISKIYEDETDKLMYIRVYGFVSNTAECFKAALDEAEAANIKNIVVDLRDNGGGFFEQAIAMADMLVPKGSIITTEDHKLPALNYVYKATSEDTREFDTVILINENSASSSEVFAAAVSENGKAKLIGTKSYGKGTIQTVSSLFYGDSMKYTVGYYLTPLGNNIDGVGLVPDAVVENTVTPFEIEKYEKFGYTKVYKKGDEGSEIRTAKELLSVWGTYSGAINETFDAALEDAVYDFQNMTGLYPYGVLDYTTQHELYTRLQKSKVVNDDQLDAAFAYFGMTRAKE